MKCFFSWREGKEDTVHYGKFNLGDTAYSGMFRNMNGQSVMATFITSKEACSAEEFS